MPSQSDSAGSRPHHPCLFSPADGQAPGPPRVAWLFLFGCGWRDPPASARIRSGIPDRSSRGCHAQTLCLLACPCRGRSFLFHSFAPKSRLQSLSRPWPRTEAARRELADKELPALSLILVDDQRTVWAAGFGKATLQGAGNCKDDLSRRLRFQALHRPGSHAIGRAG